MPRTSCCILSPNGKSSASAHRANTHTALLSKSQPTPLSRRFQCSLVEIRARLTSLKYLSKSSGSLSLSHTRMGNISRMEYHVTAGSTEYVKGGRHRLFFLLLASGSFSLGQWKPPASFHNVYASAPLLAECAVNTRRWTHLCGIGHSAENGYYRVTVCSADGNSNSR